MPGSAPPEQPDGPGFTIVAPPPAPLPSRGLGMPAATGWDEPTATQSAAPPRPYQASLPPTRPQPGVYRAPAPSSPSPAQQRLPYGQAPQSPQGFESFRPHQPVAPVARTPFEPPSEPGPPRQPPRRHDGNRSGTPLALWVTLLVILLGGGAAAALLIAHPFSHPALSSTANSGTSPTASPVGPASASAAASGATSPASPTASAPASAVTEQQAATSVAAMLSQSVSERAAIVSASNDVASCGPDLASDARVFDDAASSRQSLLVKLTAMSGSATLPPALISDLTNAWQASIAADQAYAKWATDEMAHTCVPNDTTDPGYLETQTPNTNATRYKTAFVTQWDPIAAQYGLTQYQQGQL